MAIELTKNNVEFHWLEDHEKALSDLKQLLTTPRTLKYYNAPKLVTLQVDTSQHGLCAALSQDHGTVVQASKVMNETQQRYSQIEKKLLAVVLAYKCFRQYIYCKRVTIQTDHKPLEAIFQNLLSRGPSRLQKMLLQLHEYDMYLIYKEVRCAQLMPCPERLCLKLSKNSLKETLNPGSREVHTSDEQDCACD